MKKNCIQYYQNKKQQLISEYSNIEEAINDLEKAILENPNIVRINDSYYEIKGKKFPLYKRGNQAILTSNIYTKEQLTIFFIKIEDTIIMTDLTFQ